MEFHSLLAMEPEDFFEYIGKIPYGYQDRSGRLHFLDDPDFSVQEYVFSSAREVVENNCGWCWDVANLIGVYCESRGIEHEIWFMEYRTEELHQTHTQVFIKWHKLWYPAPDNSAQEPFGAGGQEERKECVECFADSFRAYLKYTLQERYDDTRLLLKPICVPIPEHVSDDEYLELARI